MNAYLAIGALLLLAANYLQIAEEWRQRGLTDTSFKVILLLILGPALVAYGSDLEALPWHTLGYSVFAGLAGIMFYLKARDLIVSRYRLVK
jgi:hypothetical protein